MRSILLRNSRVLFYTLWFLIGVIQASATQLIDDEAYYWVYSNFLAWGYFDHPPMIALLIKLGYSLFHNELGVRLLCVLLNTLTILISEKLLRRNNLPLFYMIVLSIGMLQIGGILAVPDTPLLFFTALFFYCYKRYTTTINWKNAFILGLTIALLFFTKYHGLLVVVFTLLSNIRLLKRKETWLSFAVVILFYSPHLLWQWENNWLSFRYHLFESNVSAYRLNNTLEYLAGQLLLAGPIAGFILIPAVFLYKASNKIEKGMKYTIAGIYLVFFLSSFRGKVEANWTMPVLIPMIVLAHAYIDQRRRWLQAIRAIAVVTFLLVIAARVYMIADIGPRNIIKDRFHNNKEWVSALHEKTGDLPVVFYNSYQRASMFWFYSGKPSHSMNDYRERLNNYSLWPQGQALLGKKVFIADIYDIMHFDDSVETKKMKFGFRLDSSFIPMDGLRIHTHKDKISMPEGNNLFLGARAEFNFELIEFLNENPNSKTALWIGIFRNKECIRHVYTGFNAQKLIKKSDMILPLDISALKKGKYYLRFGVQAKDYVPVHASNRIELTIN